MPRGRLITMITAATAVLAGIAGCSSGGSGASAGTTLTMWTFKQTHVQALQQAAAAFKAQTGITVNITAYTPDDTYTAKVQSAAATHSVADVLEVHAGGEDFTFGGAGILADLAPTVDASWKSRFLAGTAGTGLVTDTIYQQSLDPKSTHHGVQKGQLFSIPFTAGTFGIVYASRSKLIAAGIDPTKPPRTWQDLLSWFQTSKAKNAAAGGVTLGLKSSSTGLDWVLEPLAYGYLGKSAYQGLFGKDSAKAWGSPHGQQVLSLYNEITPYWAAGTQTLAIDDADRAFAQGKSTFDIGGTFTMSSLEQDGMNPDDIVAFGLPAATGGAISDLKLAPIALTGLAISSQTKNKDAAVRWLNFLTTRQQAGLFAKTSLDLPGTDLGAQASTLVGPHLSSLEAVFGTGANAYNPGDNSFMNPVWDITVTGDMVVKMSPLGELSPAAVNGQLGTYNANGWK
ncbi:MAG TPA: extracellular solute-binding protein [Pseudonocardiaceae bacterium]|jgi:multiple sugar transport system substrate-binding protein|nr:extracellular solute-binding protein [Pseudonocardiaceae bacterium]